MYPDAVAIFVMPPSMEILEKRLRRRGTENEEDLVRRLTIARDEIKKSRDYDYIVINDSLEEAADEILTILNKES